MKVLVFSPYYPPHTGGLESHSEEFNKYLAREGVKILVFTPRLPKSAPENETSPEGVEIVRFPAFELIANYPLPKFWKQKFWTLWQSLSQSKSDIVVSRTRFFFTSLMAWRYTRKKGLPWIHIEHGSEYVKLSSTWKTWLARAYDNCIGSLILKRSDLNIAISRAVSQFIGRFDRRPAPVIYRGIDFSDIDMARVADDIRERFPQKIILLSVGRLYHWKGFSRTLALLKTLPLSLKDRIVFLIIGDGEDRKRLQKEAEGNTYLLGTQTRERVFQIMKATDIYIHSSCPGGGLSTSLLEAMAADLPILATPHEGADEIVSHEQTGLLYFPQEPESFARSLERLIEDHTLRQTLGEAGKQAVRQRFLWAESAKKYKRIFDSYVS